MLLLAASSHILQFRQDIVIFMGQFVPRVYGQCGFTLPINLQDDTDEEEKIQASENQCHQVCTSIA